MRKISQNEKNYELITYRGWRNRTRAEEEGDFISKEERSMGLVWIKEIIFCISYHNICTSYKLIIIFDHQRKEILYRDQRNYLLQRPEVTES